MELCTIGIGNFTQADVTAAAEAFTGWGLTPERTYIYRPRQHTAGTSTFLGHTGELSGEDVISILVGQPASARFIVASLWSHLAYPVSTDDPVVTDLLGSYQPGQPLVSLLRAIFLHPQFTSATTQSGLIKQPLEYLAGAARALRLDARLQPLDPDTGLPQITGTAAAAPSAAGSATGAPAAAPSAAGRTAAGPGADAPGRRLVSFGTALGQTMYNPPNVGGWPQNLYWLDTATSLSRLRAARQLAAAADLSALAALSVKDRVPAAANLLGIDAWGVTTASSLLQVADEPVALMTLALNAPEYVLA
jgi:uncharacterized protein (DUF1800 family)